MRTHPLACIIHNPINDDLVSGKTVGTDAMAAEHVNGAQCLVENREGIESSLQGGIVGGYSKGTGIVYLWRREIICITR